MSMLKLFKELKAFSFTTCLYGGLVFNIYKSIQPVLEFMC